ncbi:MAG TPA: hypothetical protein VNQ90_15580 [Chthoniobacteraceae bacterium]|nr:hypothetical protein [Chthoniobacteraceae bacterium]
MKRPQLTQFQALPGGDSVDADAGIIKGVSVMTIGPALGHGMDIDEKGLKQCLAACLAKGDEGVKLVINHESGFSEIVGVVKDFRIEGDQLKGDAHLLDSHPQRAHILEVASKMPKNFGLSVETYGKHEPVSNTKRKLYRCEQIDAIALVPTPAANANGLLSVDTPPKEMDEEKIAEIVGTAVADAIAPIDERLKKLEEADPENKPEENLEGDEKKEEEKLAKLAANVAAAAVTKFASTLGISKNKEAGAPDIQRGKLTKFEAKVEELVKAGVRNPHAAAVTKYPELYNEYRIGLERGGN